MIYTSHYMEEVEQICTRIAIIDHGRVIAEGSSEELKRLLKVGETISIDDIVLEESDLAAIHSLPHVLDLSYQGRTLMIRCTGSQHNLVRILAHLQAQEIAFGRVLSELPTLNDVFLEITGKQLRD